MYRIGVLALQGGVIEHVRMVQRLGAEARAVRLPQDLDGLDGLIIPGGESTTIGKLVDRFDLMAPLTTFVNEHPVWGTCAGMIFLARDIGPARPHLAVMNIAVERNAFGSQKHSFTAALVVPAVGADADCPFRAVFIRAPRLIAARGDAEIMARLPDGTPVAAREGQWLATAFHPELTDDPRFHQYFLDMISGIS